MPTYEYKCKECDATFEKVLSMARGDDPLGEPCPHCGAVDSVVKQLFSNPIGDAVRLGIRKPSAGFQERLKQIHKNTGTAQSGRWGGNITQI